VHHRAGQVLRKLGISFDFGFMLLQPWSTVNQVRNNINFLREFCEGGYTVAGFCRTLPYVGTPMERKMREEGRLTGPALEADYTFLDPRLDALWDFSLVAFAGRNYGKEATWDRLLLDIAEEALDRLETMDTPTASDPALVELARFAREQNAQVAATMNALWNTRPSVVEAELFR